MVIKKYKYIWKLSIIIIYKGKTLYKNETYVKGRYKKLGNQLNNIYKLILKYTKKNTIWWRSKFLWKYKIIFLIQNILNILYLLYNL